jgi:biotin operon repressor
MSHKVVTLVYSKRVGSAHRKAILAYCADRASDDGRGVYCSKGTIAEETEIARSTVFKTIKDLVSEGVLIESGTRPCRNGHTVVYDMNLDAIRAYQDATTSPPAGPVRDVTSPPAGPHQSASRTPTSPPAGPKPSFEPSLNQEREANASLALVAHEAAPPDRFEEFWSQYPHRNGAKKGKEAALKAWRKAIRARASPQQIITGALRYATDRQVIDGYAKDPATWLNGKGWDDEIELACAPGKPATGGRRPGMVDAFAAVAARRAAADWGG